MEIVWLFRNTMPLPGRPSFRVATLIVVVAVTFGLLAWQSSVIGSFPGVVLGGCVLVICVAIMIQHLRFYYFARGAKYYGRACRALKDLEHAVRRGLDSEYHSREYFKTARELAAQVMMDMSRLYSSTPAFQSRRRPWVERRYVEILRCELNRLVGEIPVRERPYFAVPGGYYDAERLRRELLQDAIVLHCTRAQIITLLHALVVVSAERDEYRKRLLASVLKSTLVDAREFEFFNEQAEWAGQCGDMCYELRVVVATLLDDSDLPVPSDDIRSLAAYVSSMDGGTHTHGRLAYRGDAVALQRLAELAES